VDWWGDSESPIFVGLSYDGVPQNGVIPPLIRVGHPFMVPNKRRLLRTTKENYASDIRDDGVVFSLIIDSIHSTSANTAALGNWRNELNRNDLVSEGKGMAIF